MTETEKMTCDFSKGCWLNNPASVGVPTIVKNLLSALDDANMETPDWDKVIKLRMSIAAAVGALQGMNYQE